MSRSLVGRKTHGGCQVEEYKYEARTTSVGAEEDAVAD